MEINNPAEVVDLVGLFETSTETTSEPKEDTPLLIEETENDILGNSFITNPDEETPQDTPPTIFDDLTEISDTQVEITPSSKIDVKKVLGNVFGDSIKNFTILDEEGNEKEVSIEDVEFTEELLEGLIQGRIEQIKEEEKKDKVSVKGISEFTHKLIEVDKAGGDVTQLLEMRAAYIDPLNEIDLSSTEGQKRAIFLRYAAENRQQDEIQIMIEAFESKGILEDKAKQADSEIRAAVDKKIEMEKEMATKAKIQRTEQLKEYKKNVKESLASFQLSDSVKNKLTDITSKEFENGRFQLDDMYREARRDPKTAAELALFFYDKNEYIAQVSNKAVLDKQISIHQKLKVIPKRGAGGEPNVSLSNNNTGGFPL